MDRLDVKCEKRRTSKPFTNTASCFFVSHPITFGGTDPRLFSFRRNRSELRCESVRITLGVKRAPVCTNGC